MPKKGKSTPPQREETEKGFPVPIGFIAVLAIATLAIIFLPPLIAGMSESGAVGDTANSGEGGTGGADTGANVVPEETEKETGNDQESVYAEDGTPIVIKTDFGKQRLYMTDISVEDTELVFFIENRGDFPVKMNGVQASVIIEGTVQGTTAKGGFDIVATDKCTYVNSGDRIKIIKDMKEDPRISNPNIKDLKIKITNLKFV